MTTEKLGKRIQDMRQARDMGQHDLSMASGVPVPTLYRIEKGDIENPGIDKVQAIARALKVSVSELLGELPEDDAEAREVYRQVKSLRGVDGRLLLSKMAKLNEAGIKLVETFVTGWLANQE